MEKGENVSPFFILNFYGISAMAFLADGIRNSPPETNRKANR